MRGAWYFKHDYSAKADQKVMELEMEFGQHIGYSMWFRLLEAMGEAGGTMPKKKLKLYAITMQVEYSVLCEFIKFCITIGLITETEECYFNDRFVQEYGKIRHVSEQNSKNANSRWDKEPDAVAGADAPAKQPQKQTQIQLQAKPKPKPEPAPESEDIQRLRGYVAAIIADFPDSKNSKNELTADQYQKLIDKYGYSKLVVMQRIYFEWKVSRKEKTKTTDFGTLNKGDGWVVTEADKHEPEPEQPIEEPWVRPEWKYTYPKPDNYETMDQRQINVYLVACAKEQNALETAKYIETCMAKSAQEAKEAAEQAELMRWKYPFPKPEFWDGMSEPARASYIRRNTLPEDVAK